MCEGVDGREWGWGACTGKGDRREAAARLTSVGAPFGLLAHSTSCLQAPCCVYARVRLWATQRSCLFKSAGSCSCLSGCVPCTGSRDTGVGYLIRVVPLLLLLSLLRAAEIGDALSAFEQQRRQNSTLLQQLSERDASLNTLKSEKLALQQQLESVNETVSSRPLVSTQPSCIVAPAGRVQSHAMRTAATVL